MNAPLIRNERFVQVGAPLLVGVLVLLMWQLTVMAFEVPNTWCPARSISGSLWCQTSPLCSMPC